ncbi:MAG: hypothetical protein ACTHLA_03960 [Asticcacaulis sp.]|uniref:hypothetical protein n=1 Tax=Asticcacaulis sp. TaxID=1872648 RepID=UPI003F7CCF3C
MSKPQTRSLTLAEIVALPDALPARAARLVDAEHWASRLARLIGRGPQIVVRGQRIFWPGAPDDMSRDPALLALLAHELTHVWQYADGMTLLRYLWRERGVYAYRLDGRSFPAYGYEQQAAIIEDWVRLSHGLSPRWQAPSNSVALPRP